MDVARHSSKPVESPGHLTMVVSAAIVGAGAVFRIAEYAGNRSLWLDEAHLAVSIVERSFSGLVGPLHFHQVAPLGFLWSTEVVTMLLGESEYSLRLLPLLVGLGALGAFVQLCHTAMPVRAMPFALALFAASDRLVFYCAEFKPYGCDVLCTCLLIWLVLRSEFARLSRGQALLLAGVGTVAPWFSIPSVFVLATCGSVLFVDALLARDGRRLLQISWIGLAWVVSLLACYLVQWVHFEGSPHMQSYWRQHFAPLPPSSLSDLRWYEEHLLGLFKRPVGLKFLGLGLVLWIVGVHAMTRRGGWRHTALFVMPICWALLASGLQKYPFQGRTILLLAPLCIALMGFGVYRVGAVADSPLLAIAVCSVLVLHPLGVQGKHLLSPRTKEEARPVLEHVRSHWRHGDTLYVYRGAGDAFRVYRHIMAWEPDSTVLPVPNRTELSERLDALEGLRGKPRVWLFFSHYRDEDDAYRDRLDGMGVRREAFERPGALVWLYDLSVQR